MRRVWLLVATSLLAGVLLVGMWSSIARAAPTTGIPSLLSQESVSTCAYDNMGWIICPVLRATSVAGDYAFTFVSQNFLKVEVAFYNTQSGAAQAGAIMRTVANALFVVAFLYIVYALITGRGIGNYNLKRLVPRFILAVIFVNLSYYICQIMVDISNLLGVGTQQLLVDGVAKNIGQSAMPLASAPGNYDVNPLADITSGIISKGEVAWVLLAPLTAVVMSATIISSILIIVLIIRKALIVALILLAPLAFFAYLLPNTSDYFSKWLKLFMHMLLLFPIISILIGTGQIVSASIIRAGASDYQVNDDSIVIKPSPAPQSATLYLVAAGAAVLPLVGTWYAFKAATNAIDAAGARVSRDGVRRSSRERDEKAKKREQTAMDMNKKSMMLRGINRLQQLNVAKDGESNASIFGRVGGAYRGRGKHQTKTPEQARFDSQVQQRLNELRGGSEGNRSPQELYSQALQRYQDHMNGSDIGGDGVNINSYEGIDLKASEAFLLESLGKGSGVAAGVAVAGQGGNKENEEKEKKAAGISSLDRDGKSKGSNGQTPAPDPYRPPTAGGVAAPTLAGATTTSAGAAPAGGATIIMQQTQPSAGGADTTLAGGGTGFAARRPAQDGNELLAKARAAKYVAGAQDALLRDDDLLEPRPPATDSPSESTPNNLRLR